MSCRLELAYVLFLFATAVAWNVTAAPPTYLAGHGRYPYR